MSAIKVAVIGAGQRGADVYGYFASMYPHEMKVVSVVDKNEKKRALFSQKHDIAASMQFENYSDFFKVSPPVDAVIIATPDIEHFEPARMALENNYHLLLEKPMSTSEAECKELGRISSKYNKIFMISHVLRYTPFFVEIKSLLDQGRIGRMMSIQHNENIGYFHFAHSYVRGNWRNADTSSPLILAKSCHDMDILLWMVGCDCKRISSFGELTYFNGQNAPEGSGYYCIKDCAVEHDCPFSARKIYLGNINEWPATVISEEEGMDAKVKALSEGSYGRCVFRSDNNVVDHQVSILEFENGVNATFNLSAFTNEINRTIKIMGTHGEIHGNMGKNEIVVKSFGNQRVEIIHPKVVAGGHCGGDNELCRDFVRCIREGNTNPRTTAQISVQSHMMAFAAERSRINGTVVSLGDMK